MRKPPRIPRGPDHPDDGEAWKNGEPDDDGDCDDAMTDEEYDEEFGPERLLFPLPAPSEN
jgi:hypothetical protein